MTQCKGITKKGKRCTRNASPNSDFCSSHQEQKKTTSVSEIIFAALLIGIGAAVVTFIGLILGKYFSELFQNVLNFLGISDFSKVVGYVTLTFIGVVGLKLYFDKYKEKIEILRKMNIYVLFSFYLIILALFFSVMLANKMTTTNYGFATELEITNQSLELNTSRIICLSPKYPRPVMNEELVCKIAIVMPEVRPDYLKDEPTIELLYENKSQFIKARRTAVSFIRNESYIGEGPHEMIINEETFTFDIPLANQPEFDFTILFKSKDKLELGRFSRSLTLMDQQVASDERNQRLYLIYTIFTLLTSFSIFGVFVGMNNLRQLMEKEK